MNAQKMSKRLFLVFLHHVYNHLNKTKRQITKRKDGFLVI